MKIRFIYFLIIALLTSYVLQSSRNGVAANFNLDRTGSPLSGGVNCGACHSASNSIATLAIVVRDGVGNTVTSYMPGNTYTVSFVMNSNFNFVWGVQGVALTGTNAQAGAFSSPGTATKISPLNGRQYVEHDGAPIASGTYTFSATWTAPSTGTGNVTFYGAGIVANGDNRSGGNDYPTIPVNLVLNEQAGGATIDYAQTSYCQGAATNPTPTITGVQGGTFSSTAGLALNATTGEITLAASTPGTYTVTYTFPNGTSTDQVTIQADDDASFSYSTTTYCVNDADPTPTITGRPGGSFSASAGLVINATTGTIDISATPTGTYSVGYFTNGPCPSFTFQTISIVNNPDPSFAYGQASYCQNGTDPTPSAATPGGTYSSAAGLALSSNTGVIDLSASTPGRYTITYNTGGNCPNSSTQQVTIQATDNAGFSYATSAYCVNTTDPIPTITGLTGGTFSSTNGLSINGSTGRIDVSVSTPGTYTVTYTTNGPCPNTATQSITIRGLDNASFSYSASAYCQDATDPTPTITGVAGGTFSSAGGLALNTTTGTIDVSASSPGTYTVTYATNGNCPNTSTRTVTINAVDDPSFSYAASTYCVDDTDPTPNVTTSGGTFSSTGGLALNATTGTIDVSASSPGTYTVTYVTNGICPNTSTQTVTINALDNPSFTYSSAAYCQNATDPTPSRATPGGTFSSTGGLALNANTGTIDVSASAPGTYTVTYTTNGNCPNTSTQTVAINAVDNATFSYSASAYCTNDNDPIPSRATAGGTFSSTGGLAINASTGIIDVSASTPGTYTVTYTTSGVCPSSSTQTVTINAAGNPSFAYSSGAYCQNDPNPTPTITGTTGGTFSSPSALALNSNTGAINLVASPPGTYTVTYTVGGACANSSTQTVVINTVDNASFNYSAAAYCTDDSDPTPSRATTGGTFSSTAGLAINPSTGTIDVSASTPGTYTITYTTSGICPNSNTRNVTINAAGNAAFSYANAAYCQNGTDPVPTIAGTTGGTFSSTLGLALNSSTGLIDLSASIPNTYVITYTTGGPCSRSSNVSIIINASDNAAFNYSAASYCNNGVDPTPSRATGGGTFSSTAGLAINASTGTIDLSASTLGSYTVTYVTNGPCPSSFTQTVAIGAPDNANFSYANSSYCQNGSPNPTPTITGLSGGTFTTTGSLSINSNTGTINLSNSVPGTYTVTYTTNGACPSSESQTVTINAPDNAGFAYANSAYCLNSPDPTPTITGLSGGTFSASSTNLVINPTTGEIDLSASQQGSYIVTYTTNGACPNTSTQNIVVFGADDASFNYSSNQYCNNASNPTPTVATPGGSFSSAPFGLSINPNTGTIDLASSLTGTYSVTYTTSSNCANSSTQQITISNLDNAFFAYGASSYCQTAADPTPFGIATSGSFSSAPSGLQVDPSTGRIDVSVSTPGTYTVTYTTTGTCPNSSSQQVTINALDDATFLYPATGFCQNGTDPTPNVLGASGGTFSSLPSGLSINPSTGQIDVSASSVGTYTVTYNTNGSCPNSSTVSVTIDPLDDATFSYASATYCQNGTDPTPTITGLSGGTFSSTAGLVINANTGVIDLSASTSGSYIVTYTTAGNCPNSSTQSLTINTADDASFSYASASFCRSGNSSSPVVTGLAGGTFIGSNGLSINATTGIINLGATAVGTYTVTYTTNGPCPASSTVNVTITPLDDATFAYTGSSFCQNGTDPVPTANVGGGTYTSTSGLSINATTGEVDVDNSTPGTYTITYTTNGNCPNSSTQSLTITAAQTASFNYLDTTVCINGAGNPIINVNSSTNGQFSASPAGMDIDPITGVIDAGNTSIGTYTVTFTTAGPCPATASATVIASICGNVNQVEETALYQVYPNPNQGQFTISYQGATEPTTVYILDALGKVVHYQEIGWDQSGTTVLSLPNPVPGTYWVRLQNSRGTQVQKIVVARR